MRGTAKAVSMMALLATLSRQSEAELAVLGNRGVSTVPAVVSVFNSSSEDKVAARVTLLPKRLLARLPPNVVIKGLEFDKFDQSRALTHAGKLKIYLANTSATALVNNTRLGDLTAGATLVYQSNAQPVTEATGWWSPGQLNGATFTYTGGGLLMIILSDARAVPLSPYPVESWHWISFGGTRGQVGQFLGLWKRDPLAVLATDTLTEDTNTLNIRVSFDPPAQPFLTVDLAGGLGTLENGGAMTHATGFAAGVTTPITFAVRNVGGATANVGTVSFSNLVNLAMPVVTQPLPSTLAPGASAPLTVRYTPTLAGSAARFTLNIASDALEQPFSFTLQDSAVDASPTPAIDYRTIDSEGRAHPPRQTVYGFAPVGVPQSYKVRVHSVGSTVLTLTPPIATVGGLQNATASCSPPTAATVLEPMDFIVIDCVRTVLTENTAHTSFSINHDGANVVSPGTLIVTTEGVAPLTPSPSSLPELQLFAGEGVGGAASLAEVSTGDVLEVSRSATTEVALDLRNTGAAPLLVAALSAGPTCTFAGIPVAVAAGGSAAVQMTCTSPAPIDPLRNYMVVIDSNDRDESTFILEVKPMAPLAPNVEVRAVPGPALIPACGEATVSFDVVNTGLDPLHVAQASASVGAALSMTGAFTLLPGDFRRISIVVAWNPGVSSASPNLVVDSDDPDQPRATLQGAVLSYGPAPSGGCMPAGGGGGGGCAATMPQRDVGLAGLIALAMGLLAVGLLRRRSRRG